MKRASLLYAVLIPVLLALSACGGAEKDRAATNASGDAGTAQADGLTREQLEKGIGPIANVQLGPVDEELAERGGAIFSSKCAACHKMNERYVGPPLGTILERRAPEYIMNMMLNPDEMVKQHPEAKKMLAEYLTPMPNQNLTEDDARAILEYLRYQQAEAAEEAEKTE